MPQQKILATLIEPNPYQPETRKDVPPDVAEAFGKSILEHGMIQTPLVRPVDGRFQVADGHQRFAGVQWILDNTKVADDVRKMWKSVLCDVRELTDKQMADAVLEANTVRRDLNAIELAQIFIKYREEFKVTQEDLSKKHNCSQGEIANTIRLLELPDYIQAGIISQEISQTAARHFLRLNIFPDRQKKFYNSYVRSPYSVDRLSNDIARELWEASKPIETNDRYEKPTFDLTECEGCESCRKTGSPYNNEPGQRRCFKPECWEKKQAKALEVQRDKKVKEIQASVGAEGKKAAKEIGGLKIVADRKLQYNEHVQLDDYDRKSLDNPGECDTCPKRVLMLNYAKNYDTHCIDVKCHRGKVMKKSRSENKVKREREATETKNIQSLLTKMKPDQYIYSLVLVARYLWSRAGSGERENIIKLCELPTNAKGRSDIKQVDEWLEGKSFDDMARVVAAFVISSLRYDKPKLRRALATLQGIGSAQDKAEITWRKKNCTGCEYLDPYNEKKLGDLDRKPCYQEAERDDEAHCLSRKPKNEETKDPVSSAIKFESTPIPVGGK
ncbi:MAG: ParB/RepB/Spo0J family partition protein [Dehalococcoidales bacterium]|nr:ParB/RepB/Spo0J family partition protein [Dehalococcoidales bacterium]